MTTSEAEELKKKGNEAFSSGRYEESIRCFDEALKLDPKNHILYSNRSAAYASLKNWSAALEDAEEAIVLQPNWSKGYGRKGAALLGLGENEEAAEVYEKGLELEPDNAQLQKGLSIAKDNMEKAGPQISNPFADPNLFSRLAANPETAKYLSQPDFVAKLAEIQKDPKALAKYLQDPRFMQVLSVILGVNIDMTDKPFSPAVNPSEPTPPLSTESPMFKEKVPAATAQTSSPKAPELNENEKKALEYKEQGNAAYKQREFEKAIESYDAALEMDPLNVSVLVNKSAVYFETERYEECIATCERAVELGREQHVDFKLLARALARIGSSYQRQDNLEQALVYYQKSLAEHRAGDILAKVQELQKTIKEREKAAYHSPEIAETERNAGNELFRTGQFAEAVQRYTEAIKRDEKDPRAYANRAACYLKLAAVLEGLADCRKCIELDPSFIKAYIRKAGLEMLKKDYSTALETCEAALALDKDGKHRNEIQQTISRCYAEIRGNQMNEGASTGDKGGEEAVLKRAMENPEIREILGDPIMRQILKQMESDPAAVADHMKNPTIANKIRKLIAAGIIKTQ